MVVLEEEEDGRMTSWDAAVHLCHLLSQREQEQKEVGEGGCAGLSCAVI